MVYVIIHIIESELNKQRQNSHPIYRITILQHSPIASERCGFDPLLNYTVVLEDNIGMILDQRVVSSDSCNDSCSISFSPSSLAKTCRVSVRANNAFAQSDTEYFLIG